MINYVPDDICHSVVAKLILLDPTLPDAVKIPLTTRYWLSPAKLAVLWALMRFQTVLLMMKKVETPMLRILCTKLMFNFETKCMPRLRWSCWRSRRFKQRRVPVSGGPLVAFKIQNYSHQKYSPRTLISMYFSSVQSTQHTTNKQSRQWWFYSQRLEYGNTSE